MRFLKKLKDTDAVLRFSKKFFKGVLMTATLMASMTFASGQTGVAPQIIFLETDQVLPAGLWRIRLNGDVMTIDRNTSASNNFSALTTAISIASNGDVTFPQDIFVTGSSTVTVASTITGQLFIDGSTDEIQLLVQGNATQTTKLVVFENSAGVDLLTVASDGVLRAFTNTGSVITTVRFDNASTSGSTQARLMLTRGADTGTGANRGTVLFHTSVSTGFANYESGYISFVTGASGAASQKMKLTEPGQLQVSLAGSGGGILLGGDAQWYRSAANVMRTPDALTVDGATILSGTLSVTGVTTVSDLSGSNRGVVHVDANGKLLANSDLIFTAASLLGIGTNVIPAVQFHIRKSAALAQEMIRLDNEWAAADSGPQISFYNLTEIGNFKWRIVDADSDDAYFTLEVVEATILTEKFRIAPTLISFQDDTVIDITSTEAFLVRQNADAGDIFIVDTTNNNVEIVSGALIVGGVGPHSFGGAVVNNNQVIVTGSFTSGGVLDRAAAFNVTTALTGFSGDTLFLTGVLFTAGITTQSVAEVIGDVSQLRLDEPAIILGTGSSITNASTLHISGAPTEGATGNFAILVDSGAVSFGGNLTVLGVGPHSMGLVTNSAIQFNMGGSFTEGGSNGIGFQYAAALTTATGSTIHSGVVLKPTVTTFAAADTYTIIENLRIDEPGITLGSGSSATTSASLRITGAASEATINYAFLVDTGLVGFHGTARIGALGSDGNDETPPESLSVVGGNLEIYNAATLGAETITDGDMSSSTNWAGAGDWSDTIAGTTTYTHSAGSGTLTQTAAQRVTGNEGSNARWYSFTYTVSAVIETGTTVLTITNAFAATAVTLDVSSAATRTVIFQSHATTADTADLVFSATSTTVSDTFTLDDLILKKIIGGDMIVAGKITGGGPNGISVTGGGTVFTFETGLGTVGSTETVDWRDGNHQAATLDLNLTFTFIDPSGPAGLTMKLTQDGTGTNTVAWPASVFWEGGTAPIITATGGAVDLVSLYFDGTNYFGSVLQDMK